MTLKVSLRTFILSFFIAIVVLLILIQTGSPALIRYLANRYVASEGLALELGDLTIDYLSGKVEIQDLTLSRQQESTLSLGHFSASFELLPLFRKQVQVHEVQLDGLSLKAQQLDNGWQVSGLSFTETNTEAAPEANQDASSAPSDWEVQVDTVTITDTQLWVQERLSGFPTPQTLAIKHLTIQDVVGIGKNWEGKTQAALTLNDTQLDAQTRWSVTPDAMAVDLNLNQLDLPLKDVTPYLPMPFNQSEGRVQLSGLWQLQQRFDTPQDDTPTTELTTQQVKLTLQHLKVVTDDLNLMTEEGTIAFPSLDLSRKSNGAIQLNLVPEVTLQQTKLQQQGLDAFVNHIALSSDLTLSQSDQATELLIKALSMATETALVKSGDQTLDVGPQNLKLDDFNLSLTAPSSVQLTTQITLQSDSLNITEGNKAPLLNWQQLGTSPLLLSLNNNPEQGLALNLRSTHADSETATTEPRTLYVDSLQLNTDDIQFITHDFQTQFTEAAFSRLSAGDIALSIAPDVRLGQTHIRQSEMNALLDGLHLVGDIGFQQSAQQTELAANSITLSIAPLQLESPDPNVQSGPQQLQLSNLEFLMENQSQLSLTTQASLDSQSLHLNMKESDSQLSWEQLGISPVQLSLTMGTQSDSLSDLRLRIAPTGSEEKTSSEKPDLILAGLNVDTTDIQLTSERIQSRLTETDFTQTAQGEITLSAAPDLEVGSTRLQQPDLSLALAGAGLKGDLQLQQATGKTTLMSEALSLSSAPLQLETPDPNLELGPLQLMLANLTLSTSSDSQLQLSSQIALDSQYLHLRDKAGNQLLGWESLSARPGHVSLASKDQGMNYNVKVEQISGQELVISESSAKQSIPTLARVKGLLLQNLDTNQDHFDLEQLTLTEANINLLLSADRQVNNLILPAASSTSGEEQASNNTQIPDPGADTPLHPYTVRLDQFLLSGPSSLYVSDQGVSPALEQTLYVDRLQMTDLNTANPEQITHALLEGRTSKYATVKGEIAIQPLAEKLTMDARIETRETELPPLSPYAEGALGYQIQSGQLDMKLTLAADQGQLAGNTSLILREFDLSGREGDHEVVAAGAVPLNLAVGVLKDSQDNIQLDIPMTGDVDNPEFEWMNFLLIPVRKALYKASSTYLMQTFVPYANVISIAQIAGEQLLKIRVEPLLYEPGQIAPSPQQMTYIDQLVALLKDKPENQLKMCPFATAQELPEGEIQPDSAAQLKAMAQQRGESLKDYLVDQGIASSRLLLCAPKTEAEADDLPRIEFEF